MMYSCSRVGFWVAILRSGIHATIAGVILGFMVPTTAPLSLKEFQDIGDRHGRALSRCHGPRRHAGRPRTCSARFDALVNSTESASERLTRLLNDWVSFLVLPLFALANAGVTFSSGSVAASWLTSHVAWGLLLGLVVGKPLGVIGFAKLAVADGNRSQLPHGVTWRQLSAVGMLAGIGFTVSIFISSLAFDDPALLMEAKAAVLGASVIAGVAGLSDSARAQS